MGNTSSGNYERTDDRIRAKIQQRTDAIRESIDNEAKEEIYQVAQKAVIPTLEELHIVADGLDTSGLSVIISDPSNGIVDIYKNIATGKQMRIQMQVPPGDAMYSVTDISLNQGQGSEFNAFWKQFFGKAEVIISGDAIPKFKSHEFNADWTLNFGDKKVQYGGRKSKRRKSTRRKSTRKKSNKRKSNRRTSNRRKSKRKKTSR